MDYSAYICACKEAEEYMEKERGSARSYKEAVDCFFEKNSAKVTSMRLSVGGKSMDRGYYCPSTLRDLVVVGQSRGRLLKRPRASCVPEFCYGFNGEGQLLTAVTFKERTGDPLRREVLFYKQGAQYGIAVNEDGSDLTLCVCFYENEMIRSYKLFFFDEEGRAVGFWAEEYERRTDGHAFVRFYEFHLMKGGRISPNVLNHRSYECFVKDGVLHSCLQTDYDKEGRALPPFGVHIFKRENRMVKI